MAWATRRDQGPQADGRRGSGGTGLPREGPEGAPGRDRDGGNEQEQRGRRTGGREGSDTRRRGLGEERAPGPAQGGCGSRRRELSDGEAEGAPHGDCGSGFLKKRQRAKAICWGDGELVTGLPSREEEGAVDGKGAPRPPRVRPRKLFLARPRAIRTDKAQIASTGRSPSLPRRQSPTGPPGQAAMRVTEPGSPAAELPPWVTEKTEAPESTGETHPSPLHASPELEELLSFWNGKHPNHGPLRPGERTEKGLSAERTQPCRDSATAAAPRRGPRRPTPSHSPLAGNFLSR